MEGYEMDEIATRTTAQKVAALVSIERVVAFVLGPVLVALSAPLTAWIVTWYPGKPPTPDQVTHLILVAMAGTVLLVLMWLHGRSKSTQQKLMHVGETILTAGQVATGHRPTVESFEAEVAKIAHEVFDREAVGDVPADPLDPAPATPEPASTAPAPV
jgi:hypothetical protein